MKKPTTKQRKRPMHAAALADIRKQLSEINNYLEEMVQSHDAIAELIVQLGCEGETNNDMLKQIIDVLLNGSMQMSTEQRAGLAEIAKRELHQRMQPP